MSSSSILPTSPNPKSTHPTSPPTSPTFPLPRSSQLPSSSSTSLPRPSTLSDSEEEEEEEEESIWWTAHELKDILIRSKGLKERGNALFGKGEWEEAGRVYREGLVELPMRGKKGRGGKGKGKEEDELDPLGNASEDREEGEGDVEGERENENENEEDEEEEKDWIELAELRAILFANVAASLMKLEQWKEAVQACDDALEDSPVYVKALHRRAMSNEAIGSWSSLTAALEDYTTLSTLSTLTPSDSKSVDAALKRVPILISKQQEVEKNEVLGKLKELGNGVLGKFGLSLDNFKMADNGKGGYSMNFNQ